MFRPHYFRLPTGLTGTDGLMVRLPVVLLGTSIVKFLY